MNNKINMPIDEFVAKAQWPGAMFRVAYLCIRRHDCPDEMMNGANRCEAWWGRVEEDLIIQSAPLGDVGRCYYVWASFWGHERD